MCAASLTGCLAWNDSAPSVLLFERPHQGFSVNNLSSLSTYDVLRQHGVDRRTFSASVSPPRGHGPGSLHVPTVVAAMETKPASPSSGSMARMHLLQRILYPLLPPHRQDIILNMISLDYDDTLQAAAVSRSKHSQETHQGSPRGYLLALKAMLPQGWWRLLHRRRRHLLERPQGNAEHAKAIVAWAPAPPMAVSRPLIPIPPAPCPSTSSSRTSPSSMCPAARPSPRS